MKYEGWDPPILHSAFFIRPQSDLIRPNPTMEEQRKGETGGSRTPRGRRSAAKSRFDRGSRLAVECFPEASSRAQLRPVAPSYAKKYGAGTKVAKAG
jgi:hypothetical protein